MYDAVQTLIGTVPNGWEGVVYVMCVPVLLFLVSQFFGILWSLLGGLFNHA